MCWQHTMRLRNLARRATPKTRIQTVPVANFLSLYHPVHAQQYTCQHASVNPRSRNMQQMSCTSAVLATSRLLHLDSEQSAARDTACKLAQQDRHAASSCCKGAAKRHHTWPGTHHTGHAQRIHQAPPAATWHMPPLTTCPATPHPAVPHAHTYSCCRTVCSAATCLQANLGCLGAPCAAQPSAAPPFVSLKHSRQDAGSYNQEQEKINTRRQAHRVCPQSSGSGQR
ncbi:hypothetical protein COO60DRAFT_397555 [Scenedesmus sp. NREL 46B-D3]|nr:hypothetical protein COO60DRAFT_397555 [Scenedesmus sp. NREL 46B-D3]